MMKWSERCLNFDVFNNLSGNKMFNFNVLLSEETRNLNYYCDRFICRSCLFLDLITTKQAAVSYTAIDKKRSLLLIRF